MKTITAFCMAACFSFSLQAQNSNPQRSVLLTLEKNEEICEDEYFIFQHLNQNRFACIIYDDLTQTQTFVFNGRRIITTKNLSVFLNKNFSYLNLAEENGYVFYYVETEGRQTNYYINCKGTKEGPFDRVSLFPLEDFLKSNGNHDYYYELAGRWYGHKDGKNKLIQQGKSEGTKRETAAPGISTIYENGRWYAKIDSVMSSEGYDEIQKNSILTESGKYAYIYRNKDKWHVNINGQPSQGYIYAGKLSLTDSGEYSYHYGLEDGWIYQNNNGKNSRTEFLMSNKKGDVFSSFYANMNGIEIYSKDKEYSFYSHYRYEYVVIDGRRFGNSPALHAWYDSDKNAFFWNTVEGKELVMYEYKLP